MGVLVRLPVDNPSISQPFGVNPTKYLPANHPTILAYGYYQNYGHDGIDFACPIGTPVYAAGDGVIDFSGWGQDMPKAVCDKWGFIYGPGSESSGIITLIDHGGFGTYSAHKSRSDWDNRVGQRITAGQLTGLSGNTGRSGGPHVHWSVVVFPLDYLDGLYSRRNPLGFYQGTPVTIPIAPGATGSSSTTEEDDDMPLTDADVQRIAAASAKHTIEYVSKRADGHTASLAWTLLSARDAAKEERGLIADAVWGKHIKTTDGELIVPIWILQSFHGILRDQVRNTAEAVSRLVLTADKSDVDTETIYKAISDGLEKALAGVTATVTLGEAKETP